jgi:hypothetical protein
MKPAHLPGVALVDLLIVLSVPAWARAQRFDGCGQLVPLGVTSAAFENTAETNGHTPKEIGGFYYAKPTP